MKTIAGLHNPESGTQVTLNEFTSDFDLANALNCFYCRFDAFDFSNKTHEQSDKLEYNQHFTTGLQDVKRAFRSVKA